MRRRKVMAYQLVIIERLMSFNGAAPYGHIVRSANNVERGWLERAVRELKAGGIVTEHGGLLRLKP